MSSAFRIHHGFCVKLRALDSEQKRLNSCGEDPGAGQAEGTPVVYQRV